MYFEAMILEITIAEVSIIICQTSFKQKYKTYWLNSSYLKYLMRVIMKIRIRNAALQS